MNTDAIPFIVVALVALTGLILGIVALTKDNNNSELSGKIDNLQENVDNIKNGTIIVPRASNAYNWKELTPDDEETGLYVQLKQYKDYDSLNPNSINPIVWNWRSEYNDEGNIVKVPVEFEPIYRGNSINTPEPPPETTLPEPDLCCENIIADSDITPENMTYTGFTQFITNDNGKCEIPDWYKVVEAHDDNNPSAFIEYVNLLKYCDQVGGNLNTSTGVCENICTS